LNYLGSWDIVGVMNGWVDGYGYGGAVVKDGGERGGMGQLLVNANYPVWAG